MWPRSVVTAVAAVAMVCLTSSCATTQSVGINIKRAYDGQLVDQKQLSQAFVSDTKDAEVRLSVLRQKVEAAYAQLKANVQRRWGQSDSKVASRTVYVKYTQGYKSRVITDFDHGTLIIETVDQDDPQR